MPGRCLPVSIYQRVCISEPATWKKRCVELIPFSFFFQTLGRKTSLIYNMDRVPFILLNLIPKTGQKDFSFVFVNNSCHQEFMAFILFIYSFFNEFPIES